MSISERATKIGASPTLKISARAKAMKAEGLDVIDLSVGEPDFPTPENIKAAGIKAIEQNFTKYTENDGILDLRKAVCLRLRKIMGWNTGRRKCWSRAEQKILCST